MLAIRFINRLTGEGLKSLVFLIFEYKSFYMARHNWTKEEILEIYNKPLMELLYEAASVHREYHDPNTVQVSTLLSIKTGGCPEDCGYCPQAARYHTDLEGNDLMSVNQVKAQALRAKASGSSRVCMGAAWRNVKDGEEFDNVLEMVRTINKLDMEVCCTLGMLTENQAQRLAEAGLYAYNHNLDTSEEYYKEVISTRGYEDRLKTIDNVRKTNVTVCSGGIIGMGEKKRRPSGNACCSCYFESSTGIGANKRIGSRRGNTYGRANAGADLGYDQDGCHDEDRDARNTGETFRRKDADEQRRPGYVFLCRSEFHLCRR